MRQHIYFLVSCSQQLPPIIGEFAVEHTGVFPRYLQRVFFQRVCVFVNLVLCIFFTYFLHNNIATGLPTDSLNVLYIYI